MATMLGICTNSVRLVFQELPSMPDMSTDPLAHYVPLEDLHLQRMRELDHAHRVQYTVNLEYIANLSSRLQAATELVAKTIFHVLGNNECAQKAVEGVRGCRTPELADDVARRTVVRTPERDVVSCKAKSPRRLGLWKSQSCSAPSGCLTENLSYWVQMLSRIHFSDSAAASASESACLLLTLYRDTLDQSTCARKIRPCTKAYPHSSGKHLARMRRSSELLLNV